MLPALAWAIAPPPPPPYSHRRRRLQRGNLPRGVLLCQEDAELLQQLKAFDGDGDGRLEPDEMTRARAAFDARG